MDSWPVRTTTTSWLGKTETTCPNRPEKRYRSGGRVGKSRLPLTGRPLTRGPTHGLRLLSQISQP